MYKAKLLMPGALCLIFSYWLAAGSISFFCGCMAFCPLQELVLCGAICTLTALVPGLLLARLLRTPHSGMPVAAACIIGTLAATVNLQHQELNFLCRHTGITEGPPPTSPQHVIESPMNRPNRSNSFMLSPSPQGGWYLWHSD